MSIVDTVNRMIAHAHERGFVINEIKLDVLSYEQLIGSKYAEGLITETARGIEYMGFIVRPCAGCGPMNIKIIPKS